MFTGKAVVRVTDTNGDDLPDHAELLSAYFGKGEHGNHGLVDAEDGENIFAASGNHTLLPTDDRVLSIRNRTSARRKRQKNGGRKMSSTLSFYPHLSASHRAFSITLVRSPISNGWFEYAQNEKRSK